MEDLNKSFNTMQKLQKQGWTIPYLSKTIHYGESIIREAANGYIDFFGHTLDKFIFLETVTGLLAEQTGTIEESVVIISAHIDGALFHDLAESFACGTITMDEAVDALSFRTEHETAGV